MCPPNTLGNCYKMCYVYTKHKGEGITKMMLYKYIIEMRRGIYQSCACKWFGTYTLCKCLISIYIRVSVKHETCKCKIV